MSDDVNKVPAWKQLGYESAEDLSSKISWEGGFYNFYFGYGCEVEKGYEMFTAHPPALILPFSRRFSCNEHLFESNPFGGQVAYAWYVWRRGEINTSVRWIDSSAAHAEWLGTKKEKLTW